MPRLKKQLQRLHLLVLDELGYVPFSKAGSELLFEVINRACEQHSLMVTSNLPFEQWTEILAQSASPVPLWAGSLTGVTYWRRMAKATGYAELKNDLNTDRHKNRFQNKNTLKIKERRFLTINSQIVYS
jgi:hypothetical protein